MPRDLSELEDVLWKEFDQARKRQERFNSNDDYSYSTQSHPSNFATENRKAMAAIAQAIVDIRREQRAEKLSEQQQRIEEEIENGTRREVIVSRPLKIKP